MTAPIYDVPAPQASEYTVIFKSLADIINNSQFFGLQSTDLVVYQDNKILWPVNPAPFALIEPPSFPYGSEGVGGGRFSKTFDGQFKIHLIVENIIDVSYKDTFLVTSNDQQLGMYTIVDNIINITEQSFPVDPSGTLVLAELPYAMRIAKPVRYEGSNLFSRIEIDFFIKLCESLPLVLP
jgi:hypothetical protein